MICLSLALLLLILYYWMRPAKAQFISLNPDVTVLWSEFSTSGPVVRYNGKSKAWRFHTMHTLTNTCSKLGIRLSRQQVKWFERDFAHTQDMRRFSGGGGSRGIFPNIACEVRVPAAWVKNYGLNVITSTDLGLTLPSCPAVWYHTNSAGCVTATAYIDGHIPMGSFSRRCQVRVESQEKPFLEIDLPKL